MTDDPMKRRREIQNSLARKAIWLAEINRRKDTNSQLTPEAAEQAAIAAGVRKPKPVPPSVRLARLEAGAAAGLTLTQVDRLTGTTGAEIAAEVAEVQGHTPGDGGPRNRDWPTGDALGYHDLQQRIADAEARGEDAGQLKAELLLHPNNQPKG